MYRQKSDSFTRLQSAFKIALIHGLALLGYFILAMVVGTIGLLTGGISLMLLSFVLSLAIIILGLLASYVLAMSYSKYFACRIGFFQALKISLELTFQLFVIVIAVSIIGAIIFQISLVLGFLILIFVWMIFPLTAFYFVQEWIMENKDNYTLSRSLNMGYYNYQSIIGNQTPFIQNPYYQQQYQPPIQEFRPPQQQQQQYQPPTQTHPDQPQQTSKALDQTPEIYCGSCGIKQEDVDASFCKKCGFKV